MPILTWTLKQFICILICVLADAKGSRMLHLLPSEENSGGARNIISSLLNNSDSKKTAAPYRFKVSVQAVMQQHVCWLWPQMEYTCSDIITDWGMGRGATCLKWSAHKELYSSSCGPSHLALRSEGLERRRRSFVCSPGRTTQEGSPLLKPWRPPVILQTHRFYCKISDPWHNCNNHPNILHSLARGLPVFFTALSILGC